MSDTYPLPVLQDRPSRLPASARPHWRSLAEYATGGPSPAAGEFPPGASEPPAEGPSRRELLRTASLSLAVAGLSGCFRQPEERLMPYSQRPEEVKPGVPLHFATGLELGGLTVGLVAESYEGRPTKMEGNPLHPASLGASGIHEQASLPGLYDMTRARAILHREQAVGWEALQAFLLQRATREDQGAGLRLLVEPSGSPLLQELYARILERFPRARLVPFAPARGDGEREGTRLAYERPLSVVPDLSLPRVVLSLDEDFLSLSVPGRNLRASREFVQARMPPDMNRLYVVESSLSLTGAFADHRLRVRSSQLHAVALALAAEVGRATGNPRLASLDMQGHGLSEPQRHWLSVAARDLVGHRGRALVMAGDRQPPELNALALALNEALGLPPRLIEPVAQPLGGPAAFVELVEEMRAGLVDTLVILAWNPVYAAPADVDFASALQQVPHTLYRSLHEDETSAHCAWAVPAMHPYESWLDGRAFEGTASILQPLIAPLFPGAVHIVDMLTPLAGGSERTPYELLRDSWRRRMGSPADFEERWEQWLATGVIPGTEAPRVQAELREEAVITAASRAAERTRPTEEGTLELNLRVDEKLYDGRFADNPWLQELPDPVTKLCWDNAALLSPATAERLGVKTEDRVRLSSRGQSLEAAVLVLPGQAEDTVTLSLGYGRSAAGAVDTPVGFNAYKLRHSSEPWSGTGLRLEPLGQTYPFALSQEHWSMEGRPIALEYDLEEFRRGPIPHTVERLRGPKRHFYPPEQPLEAGYQWGMGMDLHRCTGCSACVVACQAENNIPTVGKEQVRKGREMHWLRIDRYFTGDSSDPGVITQPMACVHCLYAPCEYVCPVNATLHTDEGINQMVYNRCVGTRFCSNNCPYKVRRFNYLNWNRGRRELEKAYMNPEVTVRARGVMEKCTYCVQRIEWARIQARIERRRIREDEVHTACQQACPTQAIVFGDLSNEDAEVARWHRDERHYLVLAQLGTQPRTAHLVRLKNPHPELPA
jgi:Fe-S-cluster-containing dehydrogenase component